MSEPEHLKCGGLLEMLTVFRKDETGQPFLKSLFYYCPFCNEILVPINNDVEIVKYDADEFLWDYVPIGSAKEYIER